MAVQQVPAMSVIVITPDSYSTVRKTIRRLRAQSVSHQLEIVLVVPSVQGSNIDRGELDSFPGIQIVEIGDMTSTARARAVGVQCATAPVVAFVEDHAFPAKGWAEALIQRHRQPWAWISPLWAATAPIGDLSSNASAAFPPAPSARTRRCRWRLPAALLAVAQAANAAGFFRERAREERA